MSTDPKRIAFVLNPSTGKELTAGNLDVLKMCSLLTEPQLGDCVATKPVYECESIEAFWRSFRPVIKDWHSDDQLVFYFSGHGTIRRNHYCLQVGLSDSELLLFDNLMNELDFKGVYRAIIIIDACHSGAALNGVKKSENIFSPIDDERLPKGTAIIASSQESEASYELPDGSASVFTNLLCEGIETGLGGRYTSDGFISIGDIVSYINTKLESDSEYSAFYQKAVFKIKKADRKIWIAKNKSGTTPEQTHLQPHRFVQTEEQLRVLCEQTSAARHPCVNANSDDLDWDLVRAYGKELYPDTFQEETSQEEMLSIFGFYSPISYDGTKHLHQAAVLCFHKRPESLFSQARSIFIWGRSGESDFIRKDIVGSLSFQIQSLIQLIEKYNDPISYIAEDGRRYESEPVDLAVMRELISNAIAHRNYKLPGHVIVEMTPDTVNVKNPGTFPLNTSWDDFINCIVPGDTCPVDADISLYLAKLLTFEGMGRGFKIFRQYIKKYGEDRIICHELPGPTTCISISRRKKKAIEHLSQEQNEAIIAEAEEARQPTHTSKDISQQRITSELFIGHEMESQQFREFLEPESGINILNIHSNGDGGIGKTQFLLRIKNYCSLISDRILSAQRFIDFYHVENRHRVGLMQQIASNFSAQYFPSFRKLVEQYQYTEDATVRETVFPLLEEAFKDDYAVFSSKMKEMNKIIVLFLDSYEYILLPDINTGQAKMTEFARWVETQLFPSITNNTRLFVAGRYPLQEITPSNYSVKTFALSHFSFYDTINFLQKCFGLASEEELYERFGSKSILEAFHQLVDGRPILLALLADWANYEYNSFSPKDLLDNIQEITGKITRGVTQEQRKIFEKTLIDRFGQLRTPEDIAVTYMAIAYHRMTPEIFSYLAEVSIDESRRILLDSLRHLSFIKYKEGDVLVLHNEVRRLIMEHWWSVQDPSREMQAEIAKRLVNYYERELLGKNSLSEVEREIYRLELLEYASFANPLDGLERFLAEFDLALEDGRDDYANLILHEAENYHREHPHDLPFPNFLQIKLRRIRYETEAANNYEETIKMTNAILSEYQNHPEWQHSDIRGLFLNSKGIAESWLGNFEDATNSFQEALSEFYISAQDVLEYKTISWISFVYYRQSKFFEAQRYWLQAQEGFLSSIDSRDLTKTEFRHSIQGLQLIFGNLAIVYSYMGQHDNAITFARILLHIAQHLPRNSKEIARIHIDFSHILELAGHYIDARFQAMKAENLIDQLHLNDRLLIGRLKTNLCRLNYRPEGLAYPLAYYRAEEIGHTIKNIDSERFQKAEELIQDAITILGEKPKITKELADAYYTLGELSVMTYSPEHWQRGEAAYLKAVECSKASQFVYRTIDAMQSSITLYYFWNSDAGLSEEIKAKNLTKISDFQKRLEQFDSKAYPGLFGKYEITLGNIEFDKALDLLAHGDKEHFNRLTDIFRIAFDHYVSAIRLMKLYNNDGYYFSLRVFYNRLVAFIDNSYKRDARFSTERISFLDELQIQEQQIEELSLISEYIYLRITPPKQIGRDCKIARTY